MTEYRIPEEYYFRLHHVRPRFKSDIENVLIYMAEEITSIGPKPTQEFVERINSAVFKYPGNAHRTLKTINNWRTEISALFGFIEHDELTDKPGRRAVELAANQDLVECFKVFLYNFQYPGAHIKPHRILEQINAGIHFKPAQYILRLLKHANKYSPNAVGLTKAEVCHCIFNDLRVTRDNEGVENTWQRIKLNRQNNLEYDQTGDVIRYAGDIIDYMEIANLLKTYDNRTYYLNMQEKIIIDKFCQSTEWFDGYDHMLQNHAGNKKDIKEQTNAWFEYVNRDIENIDFSTNIFAYIEYDPTKLQQLQAGTGNIIKDSFKTLIKREEELNKRIAVGENELTARDIGDIGEQLIHGHECMRVKMQGREDLIHLIKQIPSQFAVGYDINSVEINELKRFIEVKTTISAKPLHFAKIHLTQNEWNMARSTHDRYYIYRLMLSKTERKLFLLQDPVGLYEKQLIDIKCDNGIDITFNPQTAGHYEELLTWQN